MLFKSFITLDGVGTEHVRHMARGRDVMLNRGWDEDKVVRKAQTVHIHNI
jgi:hypothetical protein